MEQKTVPTPQEILDQLRYYKLGAAFPREALEAAAERQEEMIPLLLEELRVAAGKVPEIEENYMLHFYAVYLLAQFREQRALPLIVQLFSWPEEDVEAATGDLNNDLDRILASVSGSDYSMIAQLIENEDASPYSRWEAMNALSVMVAQGLLPRDEVLRYFRSLFEGKLKREPAVVWDGLLDAVLQIHPEELMDQIFEAEADGLLDPSIASIAEIEEVRSRSVENVLEETRIHRPLPIEAVEELSSWYALISEDEDILADALSDDDLDDDFYKQLQSIPTDRLPELPPIHPTPVTAAPKVGRNDQCPCGSGKKYKKCCGKEG